MTPKDKAKELVEKFKWKVNPYVGSGMLTNTHDDKAILKRSKECALICVQEIINANPQSNPFNTKPTYSTMAYWNAVKKEIENL